MPMQMAAVIRKVQYKKNLLEAACTLCYLECEILGQVSSFCADYEVLNGKKKCVDFFFCVCVICFFRCQCPPQFEGPDCQQTKHGFHGNGYAWFPPLRPCFESHLSLEFITEAADGLLLYSGPVAEPGLWDPEDFIAIGIS